MFDGKIKTNEYASIIVTHVCNRSCKFCIDKYRGSNEYIKIDTVYKACKEAKNKGIKEMLIVGGEPTVHPEIIEIAFLIKSFGFKTILTTNYNYPEILTRLDGIIDNFNISFYNQSNLPRQIDLKSDLTFSILVHKQQLENKMKLDNFIDKYSAYAHLKFSTLVVHNEWTKNNFKVDYLNDLPGDKVVLFDEIEGIIYRGCMIKRYDKIINNHAYQSLKFHVDGEISNSWIRAKMKADLGVAE